MEVTESKIKILSLEMPEGAENNDLDDDIVDDLSDPHKALAQIRFDDFIQEKALKSINELSLKEKSSKKSSKSKSKLPKEMTSKDANGIKKSKKKTKTKDDEQPEKKSKKSKKIKKDTGNFG